MRYFEQFPVITYGGYSIRNIMLKASIVKDVFDRKDTYYPYVVQDGERPDTIAYDYYGDSNYSWVVLFSNGIIDQLQEWPKSDRELNSVLIKKYGLTVDTLKSTIKHYKYTGIGGNVETEEDVLRKSWTIPTETWSYLTSDERSGWSPVYVYDWEVDQNHAKRSIRLLDKTYLKQIQRELAVIFNG